MLLPPFNIVTDGLDITSSTQFTASEYAHIQASKGNLRSQKADASTPDHAMIAPAERATPGEWSVSLRPEVNEWTPKHKRRFSQLAAKYALDGLTPNEEVEYKELTQLRRQLDHPRSGSEVVADYERRKAMAVLEEALNRYVYFFDGNATRC